MFGLCSPGGANIDFGFVGRTVGGAPWWLVGEVEQ